MIAIDTNLLVYAHRSATPEHIPARQALERAAADPRGWGFSIGNVLEFWSVATHLSASGRPSTANEAQSFIRSLFRQGGAQLWLPLSGFGDRVLAAALEIDLTGPRIFDLQIAMVALENGATEIWTHDRNFLRLPKLPVRDPLA